MKIHQLISRKGYSGSVAAIKMFMQNERAHAKTATGTCETTSFSEYVYRKTLSQLVYHELESVKLITEIQYKAILKRYPELAKLYSLIKEYNRILFSKKPDEIGDWLKQAEKMKALPELQSYVEGLKQDLSAVKNAILHDYNNGLAEGSVTKIKLIKRIIYGRNSFELLKSKVLLHEFLYGKIN